MNVRVKILATTKCSRMIWGRKLCKKAFVANRKKIEDQDISTIRNIGILAHIDAGKTTTTERMLFYSGTIDQMGEVHHGNTVTDFMQQERLRGITISSASVTFPWKNHIINLLDTPGHIDFTMEVEQTLNVMDGAVVILDGSAGVEAQTLTVWRQADRHKIPRIIYVNKMDKKTARLSSSIESVKKQLRVVPVVLQLPFTCSSNEFVGVVDLLTLQKCEWDFKKPGMSFSQKALSEKDEKLWENAVKARIKLVETLADLDDELAELVITEDKTVENISAAELRKFVKKVTLNQKGVPVVCGSSYKNVGVELLMDGINDYLPSPLDGRSGNVMRSFGTNFCARAFKVRHDEYKGPVTFFRVYSGEMSKGQKIFNVDKKKSECCGKLYIAYADDYAEVPRIEAGNIAAVTGLKVTSAGDVVASSAAAFSSAQKTCFSKTGDVDQGEIFSSGLLIPEPVFFCSIEAPSQSQQAALDKALAELEREDPSLKVTADAETGQTVLGGMGELHLEIIKERIRQEYKVEAETGPLQIAYKEALLEDAKDSSLVDHQIGASHHSVRLTMSVLKSDSQTKERLVLDRSPECAQELSSIFPKHLQAVKNGVKKALMTGPKLLCPVVNVLVMLHSFEVGKGTSEPIIVSATVQCVKKLLKKGGTRLLEPLMLVEVVCGDDKLQSILNDLGRRRAELIDTEPRGTGMVVKAFVPLSELLGYATDLRILSSGTAAFSMEFHSLRGMNEDEEAKAIKSVTGLSS